MTRKEALTELLGKVDAGEWNPAGWAWALDFDDNRRIDAKMAFDGSLDAAKSLHEAVLPGWGYLISCQQWVDVWEFEPAGTGTPTRGKGITPARAWLIAILKALIEECDE